MMILLFVVLDDKLAGKYRGRYYHYGSINRGTIPFRY